jgi:hypothetical protein
MPELMTTEKVWLITGAGRGMGVDFARAALDAGHAVVATGRDTDAVAGAVGEAGDLLVARLDVTSRADAGAAVHAAVDRFGRIDVLVNNAGFFRTELLTEQSVNYAQPSVEDYDERRAAQLQWWHAQNGQQPGDPTKLAQALVTIASEEEPPRRFIAGADAVGLAEQKVAALQEAIDAYPELSTSLALKDAQPV